MYVAIATSPVDGRDDLGASKKHFTLDGCTVRVFKFRLTGKQ